MFKTAVTIVICLVLPKSFGTIVYNLILTPLYNFYNYCMIDCTCTMYNLTFYNSLCQFEVGVHKKSLLYNNCVRASYMLHL